MNKVIFSEESVTLSFKEIEATTLQKSSLLSVVPLEVQLSSLFANASKLIEYELSELKLFLSNVREAQNSGRNIEVQLIHLDELLTLRFNIVWGQEYFLYGELTHLDRILSVSFKLCVRNGEVESFLNFIERSIVRFSK